MKRIDFVYNHEFTFPKEEGWYLCENAWGEFVFLYWSQLIREFCMMDAYLLENEIESKYIVAYFDGPIDLSMYEKEKDV